MKKIGETFTEIIGDGFLGCMGCIVLFIFVLLILGLPTIWHESHAWGFVVFACIICPIIKVFIDGDK